MIKYFFSLVSHANGKLKVISLYSVMLTFTVEDLDLITDARSAGELYTQAEQLLISFFLCMRHWLVSSSEHTGFSAIPILPWPLIQWGILTHGVIVETEATSEPAGEDHCRKTRTASCVLDHGLQTLGGHIKWRGKPWSRGLHSWNHWS